MIPTLLLLAATSHAAEAARATADRSPLEAAVTAELQRTVTSLRLPDAPAPSLVAYDVLDGDVVNVFAEQGALVSSERDRYRNLRVEVRVGDATTDSSNFSAFGEPNGVVQRRLPVDDDPRALQREIWLATDSAYKYAIEQFSRKIASRRDNSTPHAPDWASAPPVVATIGPLASAGAPMEADRAGIERLVARLSAELATFGGIEIAQAIARDWQGQRLLLTSEHTRIQQPTGYTVLRVEGTIRLPDGSTLTDARGWVARTVAALPEESALIADVRALGSWLTGLRDAPVEEDYLGPVLFEGAAATDLFAQLVAPEIVGTPPMEEEGSSPLETAGSPSARLGRRLLPLGWSVVDDAAAAGTALGRYAYDQEGVAPTRVELVTDGVVRDLLMSRIPRKDRAGSTGHGRSLGSARRTAVPAVVTVTPAHVLPDARLRRMGLRLAAQTGRDYLLVVRRLMPAALVERLDMGFAGEGPLPGLTAPYEAYRLYADGRTEPVRSLRFSGVDRRVLRDIAAAGAMTGPVDFLDDAPGPSRFQIGPTGGLPVTWNVPAVLIAELELTGGGGGEPRVLELPPRK